jgi:hypothetical protein
MDVSFREGFFYGKGWEMAVSQQRVRECNSLALLNHLALVVERAAA